MLNQIETEAFDRLAAGRQVKGLSPGLTVEIIMAQPAGAGALQLIYKLPDGTLQQETLYRDRLPPGLSIVEVGPRFTFTASGKDYRQGIEALRIKMASEFDPFAAVHSSAVDPLPHQIDAVYRIMLPRHPLRFLLADDPGAGKTIMAGLLIRELMLRGSVRRCAVFAPGSLVEQWQDELLEKFSLRFTILSRELVENSPSGNWFKDNELVICRLDQVSRDEGLQQQLTAVEWDLAIFDEAHKLSASAFGKEVKKTQRYKLGELVGPRSRNLLLMTATPHNGKEEDFQRFLALIDPDRFEGRLRDNTPDDDAQDLIRRMLKEELVRFDGTPLFPERIANTVRYELSSAEQDLYEEVTKYVQQEFDRADKLETARKTNIGFALTVLQRRLASSPAAIYHSLRRRRERLENRLQELRKRPLQFADDRLNESGLDEDDLDELNAEEQERCYDEFAERATAARNTEDLQREIETLRRLEEQARELRASGRDRKWEELSRIFQQAPEMFDAGGSRRKLLVFTEHRDTLEYLADRLTSLMGKPEAVVMIRGGMSREDRKRSQDLFTQDPEVTVLVATDAAGEGVNLQRAHLMINYDLPWNPNRLEQRFGRIHRIGQTEVCHLWNLVAHQTREGKVWERLFEKLEEERRALGGKVFDVLGEIRFGSDTLRQLLIEAVRYGNQPEVRDRLSQAIESSFDSEKLKALLAERALHTEILDADVLKDIRQEMERARMRRLQPHFIQSFFLEAFERLGGFIHKADLPSDHRYTIGKVPARLRESAYGRSDRHRVLERYERVTFHPNKTSVASRPVAELLCPGQPLFDTVLETILEELKTALEAGAVLFDPCDESATPRLLFVLKHELNDAYGDRFSPPRVASSRLQFLNLYPDGRITPAGPAPILDLQPLPDKLREASMRIRSEDWCAQSSLRQVEDYATSELALQHFTEYSKQKEVMVERLREAVRDRLRAEINYWEIRAVELGAKERSGAKVKDQLNSANCLSKADELRHRLDRRMTELDNELRIRSLPPVILTAALVLPAGMLAQEAGETSADAQARALIERAAMEAVSDFERKQGRQPRDVSANNLGYDIESYDPSSDSFLFLEVKGRQANADSITLTHNEMMTAFNGPERYRVCVVLVDDEERKGCYLKPSFLGSEVNPFLQAGTFNLKDIMKDEFISEYMQ